MIRMGIALGGAMLLTLGVAPARAELPRPACEALGRWAGDYQRNAGWSPNALRLGGRARFNALFAAPATATLFGKPVLEWTPDEARALAPHVNGCADTLRRARNRDAAGALGALRTQLQRDVPNFLTELAASRTAAPARIAELGEAEPSLALLRLHLALAELATEAEAAQRLTQSARSLPAPQRPAATALIDALRDLPEAELAAILAPAGARVGPLRAALADGLIAEIDAAPAAAQGLQQLDRLEQRSLAEQKPDLGAAQAERVEAALASRRDAIGMGMREALLSQVATVPNNPMGLGMLDRVAQQAQGQAAALGEAGLQAVAAAIAQRRTTMGEAALGDLLGAVAAAPASIDGLAGLDRLATQSAPPQLIELIGVEGVARLRREASARRNALGKEVADGLVQVIAAIPAESDGFARLDRVATPQNLTLLPTAEAMRVSAAQAARRRVIAETLMAEFRRALAELPLTDAGLEQIDGPILRGLGTWPGSAEAERARFTVLVRERRAAILAAVNRAEAGALRGRVYEDDAMKLEFVDRGRVVATVPGETPAGGAYTEEADGRVFVEVNGQSIVLTREGRRLVGGPLVLRRTR